MCFCDWSQNSFHMERSCINIKKGDVIMSLLSVYPFVIDCIFPLTLVFLSLFVTGLLKFIYRFIIDAFHISIYIISGRCKKEWIEVGEQYDREKKEKARKEKEEQDRMAALRRNLSE